MLFFWAVRLADQYDSNPANRSGFYDFKLKIADKLIFSKWREALGGSIRGVISGGAALQPRLARAFWAANIFVEEGYGLTETSPLVSANGFTWLLVKTRNLLVHCLSPILIIYIAGVAYIMFNIAITKI
ncbi:MAG: hypothetical protein B7C24_01715 [Bacteroidetes bacterium 4572_77]|nr:MAG: hypothetical protein B7C24_01715 [Bacteroidetes bacterium 4572_77]